MFTMRRTVLAPFLFMGFSGGLFPQSAPAPIDLLRQITPSMLIGSYHRDPYNNEWHGGRIEADQESLASNLPKLSWRNDAGVSWRIIPQPDEGGLLFGEDNPYYPQNVEPIGGRQFRIVLASGHGGDYLPEIAGFQFDGDFYVREPVDSRAGPSRELLQQITPAMLAGNYHHDPYTNGWHGGRIELDQSQLRWYNDAGVSWTLLPKVENGLLLFGEDDPYSASGQATVGRRQFRIVLECEPGGAFFPRVAGYQFNGEYYRRD
jgi:hypothetical protein